MEYWQTFPTLLSGHSAKRLGAVAIALLTLVQLAQGQCVHDYRSDKMQGIIVDQIALSGTRTVSSTELARITSAISGSCFGENSEDIKSAIADEFRQHGYFEIKVTNLSIEPSDPLALPKPVNITADVTEGSVYRLSDLQFSGNRIFPAQRLQSRFPIKVGDVFSTEKIRSGLDALRHLYGSEGYVDFQSMPTTELHSNQTVTLKLAITEGKQYRMGRLEVFGKLEESEPLETRWSLRQGSVFDAGYVQRFLDQNPSLLPSNFNELDDVRAIRDCRDSTVNVAIVLNTNLAPRQFATEVGCDKGEKSRKQ